MLPEESEVVVEVVEASDVGVPMEETDFCSGIFALVLGFGLGPGAMATGNFD